MTLPNTLERTISIEAPPETVFRFFTDSQRWASWWGAGSTIDPRPGGAVQIRFANGIEILGEVLEIEAGRRIVFTYGYASGQPIKPGESRVVIELRPIPAGCELRLTHSFADSNARDLHIQGWRYQLSLFANAVANEVHADAAAIVDGWYRAWTLVDAGERARALEAIASPGIEFRDRHSLLRGFEDISSHIAAAQRFRPGITLQRKSPVRQCLGTALADWSAVDASGVEQVSGTSVFRLGHDGKIVSATGIANP